jgi:NADPH:quinone reductase-like Zn-dependent oxidoreductase
MDSSSQLSCAPTWIWPTTQGRRVSALPGVTVEPDYVGLERLSEMVSSGLLHVRVEHSFPLEQIAKAHELLMGNTKGKIVLSL